MYNISLKGFFVFFMCLLLSQPPGNTLGDVNSDDVINVQDIIRLINIIMENYPPPSEYEEWASDVNADNAINIQDIIVLVSVILNTHCNEINEYPCPYNLSICCFDTTSHSFSWDIQYFGAAVGNINILNDIHILSDDDIWVVGELLEFEDDTINNYIHWDGVDWTASTILQENGQSQSPSPLLSIFGFQSYDLWAANSLPYQFIGDEWYMYLPDMDGFPSGLGGIYHIYGSSSEDMFFGEYSGDVVHWDGIEFAIMETTTGSGSQYNPPYQILDLFGLSANQIWTIAGHPGLLNDQNPLKLSFYNGEQWIDNYIVTGLSFDDQLLSGRLYNAWAFDDSLYIATSYHGIWKESISTGSGAYITLDSLNAINLGLASGVGLCGNNYNDIVTVSQSARYAHYNGLTWYFGNELLDLLSESGDFYTCGNIAIKDDVIIITGDVNMGQQVWVATGIRTD